MNEWVIDVCNLLRKGVAELKASIMLKYSIEMRVVLLVVLLAKLWPIPEMWDLGWTFTRCMCLVGGVKM